MVRQCEVLNMMNLEYIAHVAKDVDGNWIEPHLLVEHLEKVGEIAGEFASKFNSKEWGMLAGVVHDAGKARMSWQKYLRVKSEYLVDGLDLAGSAQNVRHAIHGAKLVEIVHGKGIGRIISYCVAGHHVGLQDWSSSEGAGQASLEFQMSQVKDLEEVHQFVWNKARSINKLVPPWMFSMDGLEMSLWIRMLYSCLVDADFLDTEAYMEPERSIERSGFCSISELLNRLNHYNDLLVQKADNSPLNRIRREIREKCVQMGRQPQGVFSLSVPTGGGKTLSSLAFALEHAKKHNLSRVIYVIPYTSIIEQNADQFRKALGDDQVIEHHSSIDEGSSTYKSRLAAENWDAPIIVTTSVQFFESLFANKSSRCRKLHNIVNSVVVLDEAQLLPVGYLQPILETMQLLVDYYGVTFVICTATQPALGSRIIDGHKFKGLRDIHEIIGDETEVKKLYDSLKRVEVHFPDNLHYTSTWEEIAEELVAYEQVLCIVSDRKSCRDLHALMPKDTYHLSALMCGEHRSRVIEEIKDKLKQKMPCRVISTQLVEAGVDIDFPVVYRAFAGLDSIAQAAGRCNREGKLSKPGKVVVFMPPSKPPVGLLRKAAETTHSIIASMDDIDPLNHSIFEKYFAELYWKANSLDEKGIIKLLKPELTECGIFFKTAAERFQIIDSTRQRTILVRYGEGSKLIDLLKYRGPDRSLMRRLQRYTVNVYTNHFYAMLQRGSIEEVHPEIYALTSEIEYDQKIGLLVDETLFNPSDLII